MVADVTVPDGAVIEGGKAYLKTWLLRNTGSCTWTTEYQLAFVRGEQMGVPLTVTLPSAVPPGVSANLSLTMTAPLEPGHYRGNWQLRNAAGKNFGISNGRDGTFWVDIVVNARPAPAKSPTATSTATPSPTATIAPTLKATATPSPAATATAASVPASTPTGTSLPAVLPSATLTGTPLPTATAGPNAQATAATPAAERVLFPPGASGVTLMANLGNGQSQTYVLGAANGQVLTVDIQPGSTLSVTSPQGLPLLPASVSLGGAWTYHLPITGDYTLVLTGSGPNLISFLLR
jgi:hypothetical protein